MSTTPSGVEWAFPLQLRTLLAACSGFRTWIDADTVSAATALIGWEQIDNPTQRTTGDCYGFVDVNESGIAGIRESTGAGIEAFRLSSQTAAWGLEWRVQEFTAENTVEFLNLASTILGQIFDQADARNIVEFRRFDPKTYPLKRLDGNTCRYQIAYAMTARQGPY